MGGSFVIQPTETYPACQYVVKNPATWNPAATSAADLDGCTTLAAGERVLCPSGTSVGIWVASSATVCVADPTFVVHEGYTVRCVRSAGAPTYIQESTGVFRRQIPSVYYSSESAIAAGSGTHVLLSIPIDTNTDLTAQIAWNCYDGTATNRVLGQTAVTVARGVGVPVILQQAPGADYVDTTAGTSGAWDPTVALNGNNLEVRLTADPYNQIIPIVAATVSRRITADAPAPVDPVVALRAALHATAPVIELYSDVGRTPSDDTSGTVVTALADQSGNGHNATVSGGITYTPNASTKPALLYPASGGRVAPSGAIPASQSHTFSWRYKLGDAKGAAIEIILSSDTSPAAMFVTINWTTGATTGVIRYSNKSSTGYDVGTVPDTGTHDYTLVLDETAHTATLYIDGVAGTPITTATGDNQWAIPRIGGSATNAATYPLISGNLHAFCYWGDAGSPASRDAAFRALCAAAYGAHS